MALLIGGALLVVFVVVATVVVFGDGAESSHRSSSLQISINSNSSATVSLSPHPLGRIALVAGADDAQCATGRAQQRGQGGVLCAGDAYYTAPHHTLTMDSVALGRATVAAKAVAGNEASEK